MDIYVHGVIRLRVTEQQFMCEGKPDFKTFLLEVTDAYDVIHEIKLFTHDETLTWPTLTKGNGK